MVVVRVGGSGRGFTRREGLRRLKERLEKEPGLSAVRYRPSRLRPRSVVADVDIEVFLGTEFPRSEATLEVAWRPRTATDVQRVQWADSAVSLGWHKDDDHDDSDPLSSNETPEMKPSTSQGISMSKLR